MKPALEALAAALADAWRRGATIALPPAEAAPSSRDEAFAVQERMAALLGERVVGWKVGAAVRAVQILEGHDGPILGRMFAARMFTDPGRVPAALLDGYKIECEFAFRFDAPVPRRSRPYGRDDLVPIVTFHPGLEVAGSRYAAAGRNRRFTTYDAIADNGAGGAYVVGPAIADWRGIDFAQLDIDARIDGAAAPIEAYTGELRRDAVDILVETVNALGERGVDFAPGDLVSTGSLTTPTALHRGQTLVARFGGLATLSVTMA